MTDYTPTTEQVRDAYVRGMRDTFIASAGEHREEFDWWVQAHDEEVLASVQPPTREQITAAVLPVISRWYDTGGNLQELIADAVLALFPQPTPSAEPVRYNGHNGLAVFADAARRLSEGNTRSPAEPVSIADMAPNTTFTAQIKGESEDRWARLDSGGAWVVNARRQVRGGWLIDPSTIRDVTPPPATPEE